MNNTIPFPSKAKKSPLVELAQNAEEALIHIKRKNSSAGVKKFLDSLTRMASDLASSGPIAAIAMSIESGEAEGIAIDVLEIVSTFLRTQLYQLNQLSSDLCPPLGKYSIRAKVFTYGVLATEESQATFMYLDDAKRWIRTKRCQLKNEGLDVNYDEIELIVNDERYNVEIYLERAWTLIAAANQGHPHIRWRPSMMAKYQGSALEVQLHPSESDSWSPVAFENFRDHKTASELFNRLGVKMPLAISPNIQTKSFSHHYSNDMLNGMLDAESREIEDLSVKLDEVQLNLMNAKNRYDQIKAYQAAFHDIIPNE